jgi:hypothetical protein
LKKDSRTVYLDKEKRDEKMVEAVEKYPDRQSEIAPISESAPLYGEQSCPC